MGCQGQRYTLKTCTEHSVALDARARAEACATPLSIIPSTLGSTLRSSPISESTLERALLEIALSFLSLLFEEGKENRQEKTGWLIPTEPLNSLENQESFRQAKPKERERSVHERLTDQDSM